MNGLTKLLLLGAICIAVIAFTVELVFAATDPVDATCAVSCTVDTQFEWAGDFTEIAIVEHLTEQNDQITGSGTATLWTNGDVTLTADNDTDAQLSIADPADTLVTEYKLEYDGNGAVATGGATVDYTEYDTFIAVGSDITHVDGDGAVVVTLTVRASHDTDNVANRGAYSATQTITATWNE